MKPNYRRCISCRQVAPKESFWRVVRIYPSHDIRLDVGIGRSAYLCRQADCLKTAKLRKCLRNSLKVKIPEHIYQSLQERLISRC
ncbi:MAG: YlxR family protein [Pleurocapsa sp.]